MKFKLDENLGRRGKELLIAAGYDVSTVYDQHLTQANDTDLIEACQTERRCLVTLDLDFGNPLRFNPAHYPGIAVIRLPPKPSHDDLLVAMQTLARAVDNESISHQPWIVERARIRIYRPDA